MPFPIIDLRKALEAHGAAIDYAVRVQHTASAMAEREKKNLVAEAALSALSHEAVILHRAVASLAEAGWVSVAPILLRSMLDITLSTIVIITAEHPDIAGFKYLYAFTKDDFYKSNPAAQREAHASISVHMSQMQADDQQAAEAFLQRPRAGAYWYSEDFTSPSKILEKHATPGIGELWRRVSSAAHGGYIGVRILRDEPFEQSINRRLDPRSVALAVIGSTRLLIEQVRLREKYIGVLGPEYEVILRLIADAGAPEAEGGNPPKMPDD